MHLNRSHEIGTLGKLDTPPGSNVFDGSNLFKLFWLKAILVIISTKLF